MAKSEWKQYTDDEYQLACNELIHLSAKQVNSNVEPGGVRLIHCIDLPYLAISTCDPQGILLESQLKGGAASAPIFKQIFAVTENNLDDYEGFSENEIKKIKEIFNLNSVSYANLMGEPNSRLKQIIFPGVDGDVVLTPLHSSGFMTKISKIHSEFIDALNIKEKSKKFKVFNCVKMGYGGANKINIGIRSHSLCKPMYFKAPTESNKLKKCFSLYYKGVNVFHSKLISDYLDWLDSSGYKNKTNLELRSIEEKFIQDITKYALSEGLSGLNYLKEHSKYLPNYIESKPATLVSDLLDFTMIGLIIPSERNANWRKSFSWFLAKGISEVKRIKNNKEINSGMQENKIQSIRSIIESEIL